MLSSPGVVGLDFFVISQRQGAECLHLSFMLLFWQPILRTAPRSHLAAPGCPTAARATTSFPSKASPNLLLIISSGSFPSVIKANNIFCNEERKVEKGMFGARVGSMARQPSTFLQSREAAWAWLLITQRNTKVMKLWQQNWAVFLQVVLYYHDR